MHAKTSTAVWTAFLLAVGLSSALSIAIELLNPAREMFWNDTKGALIFDAVMLAFALACSLAVPTWTVVRTRPKVVGVSLLIIAIPAYLTLTVIGGILGLTYGARYDTWLIRMRGPAAEAV